jgi:hypothetical protein
MKRTLLFAAAILFMVATNLNSFGYSILCQSAAKGISVNEYSSHYVLVCDSGGCRGNGSIH